MLSPDLSGRSPGSRGFDPGRCLTFFLFGALATTHFTLCLMALASVTRGAVLLRELATLLEGLSVHVLAEHKEEIAALFADVEEELEFWREVQEPLLLEAGSMPAATEDLDQPEAEDDGIDLEDELPVLRRHHSRS